MKSNHTVSQKNVLLLTNDQDCKSHIHHITKAERYFVKNGWKIAKGLRDFDSVVIGACGFHNAQFEKVMRIVGKLKRINFPEKDIIIIGCLPRTHESDLDTSFNGKLVPYGEEEYLDELIGAEYPFKTIKTDNLLLLCEAVAKNKEPVFYINTGIGCLGACSYCVIKKAKGNLRSFPVEKIVEQYKEALKKGYKKVNLYGEDTFAYGLDIGTNIIKLIETLLQIDDTIEILFDQLDMKWLLKYSTGVMSLCKRKVFKRLGIGMQHTNDYILERMRRKINFKNVYEIIKEIKRQNPHIYIVADIIVGFPGETREIFNQMVEFLKNDQFIDAIKHAGYSDNKHAFSYTMHDKVDEVEITNRWKILKEVLKEKSLYNYAADFEGFGYIKTLEDDLIICKNTYVDNNHIKKI
jgi:MiaB/RimO family radical SAM methylthiotransferase